MNTQNIEDYFLNGTIPVDNDEIYLLSIIKSLIGNSNLPVNDGKVEAYVPKDFLSKISVERIRILANTCIMAQMAAQYNHAEVSGDKSDQKISKADWPYLQGIFKNAIKDRFTPGEVQGGGTNDLLAERGVI